MLAFHNDNHNTYNLRNQREPITDGIPLALHPKPPNLRANNNLVPTRAPYIGQQNQNQGNMPTILKNPIWATGKYNAVEDLKRTKANISMFDMLQNCPNQREVVLRTLDHAKAMLNANIVPQKTTSQQVNTFEAMPTMYKEKGEVPPFSLSLRIFGKNLHNCLIDSRSS